jgi:hypothetical protein
MSVLIWWKERLAARAPLREFVPRYDLKPNRIDPNDTWPHSCARQALVEDYRDWHERFYLKPYREVPYYEANPDKLPQVVSDFEFFSTMVPYLYVIGKDRQVRTYQVPCKKMYDGRWMTVRVTRYFVRFAEWKEHVAAFETSTGMHIEANVLYFEEEKAKLLSNARIA